MVEAKRRTYAGLDDDATVAAPFLPGSKQLEHRADPFVYRDIYFGMRFFVGQETVSKHESVIWSMCYSGGVRSDITERATFLEIYKVLRQALQAGNVDMPYRGPACFTAGPMTYRNNVEGTLERFQGAETISQSGSTLYELRYSGGLLI